MRELVASGEKPKSFLVQATAKQVLIEHEPQLLETNESLLTISWAKSFLRRMDLGKWSDDTVLKNILFKKLLISQSISILKSQNLL